jgi:2-hydroxychromene-2-carboxylate isomerase
VKKATRIDFYLDFISPFGYLARHALSAITAKYGAELSYHPVDIVLLKRAAGNTGPSNRDIPAKCAYLTEDIQRWAKRYRIPMARSLPGSDTSRLNKGLFLAQDELRASEYVQHAWECVWRDGLDPGIAKTLAELATRMRWNFADFTAYVESTKAQQRFEDEIRAATRHGVFGVPTFIIGDAMWWGNDRLDFVEQHLERESSPSYESSAQMPIRNASAK